MHERIRDSLLGFWGRTVASRPKTTLLCCLGLAVLSVVVTITRLEFHADRSDLVDPDLSWNKQYAQYKENFPRWNDVYVVLDGDAEDQRVDALARTISENLRADQRVVAADAGFDHSEAGPKFFAIAPAEQFAEALQELGQARRLAATENANTALGLLLASVQSDEGDVGALDRLEQFLKPYLAAMDGQSADFSFLSPRQSNWQPLRSQNGTGRLRFIRVQLANGDNEMEDLASALQWLRTTVGSMIAESSLPKTEWGVTGIGPIEADETSQSIKDSTFASILAIILITLLMLAAFRGAIVPLFAASALLVGIAWSFGWLSISIGHLQLLSVVFSVILLGLGVDFALLFVSRLELVQDEHKDLPSATARVFRGIGPGMLTGAVTTAAAFASTALTQFKGMAEMGIIAAGGILLCLVAVLSVFPACLALTGRWKKIIRHRPGGEEAHFAHGRLDFVDTYPKSTLTVAAVLVIGLGLSAQNVRYDSNVLNLQPPSLESVQWNKRVVADDARSVWAGLVVVMPHRAAELCSRLRGASNVAEVGGMGLLCPADWDERESMIAQLRDESTATVPVESGMASLLTQLNLLRAGIALRLNSIDDDTARSRLTAIVRQINQSVVAGMSLRQDAQVETWNDLNAAFVAARTELGSWVDQALSPGPPGADDLPGTLRKTWVGLDGSWLLQVYPQADPEQRSILDPLRLSLFVQSMRGALQGTEAAPIGPPVQIYESSELIQRAYQLAAVYAIAAILVLLFLDFRSLADALCAMTPVTIGFVGAFGIMGIADLPLNFANMIILPVIFGIGVNAGVHTVHRWRVEPYGRPAGLSGATGRGITLTMLTTMIGFGCLLIAEHRGIRSLAVVMLIGLSITLCACYTVLPAILRLRTAPTASD